MVFQDVASCPPELVLTPHFLIMVVEVKTLGTTTCFKTVVGGKQGHASCKIFLTIKASFLF